MQILATTDTGLPEQAKRLAKLYSYFGEGPDQQRNLSPASQLGPWLGKTAFLIISAGLQLGHRQSFTKNMAQHFLGLLHANEVRAEHFHLRDWEHTELISRFDGELQIRVETFLDSLSEP
jgi:hypothetical protein